MNLMRILPFALAAFPISIVAKPDILQIQLDKTIKQAIADNRIVGAVVMVSQNGQIVYQGAYGWQDREAQIPMTPNTVFRLASLTKPIVTVAALELIDKGKLRLDDPVTRWLPDFKPKTPDGVTPTITIKNLLTHTAGLNYGFFESVTGPYHKLGISDGLDKVNFSLDENLKRLESAPLLFYPGSAWNYSLATDVLGAILSRVESAPLPDVVDKLVLKPLDMRETGFTVKSSQALAVPYANSEPKPVRMIDGQKIPFDKSYIVYSPSRAVNDSYPSGGAGMVGTAGDYLRFLESIRIGTIPLKRTSLKMLTSNQIGDLPMLSGPGWGWSLGFSILKDPKLAKSPQGKGTYQWGGVWGNSWWVDPQNKLSVVILTNTALEGTTGKFPMDIMKIIYNINRDD